MLQWEDRIHTMTRLSGKSAYFECCRGSIARKVQHWCWRWECWVEHSLGRNWWGRRSHSDLCSSWTKQEVLQSRTVYDHKKNKKTNCRPGCIGKSYINLFTTVIIDKDKFCNQILLAKTLIWTNLKTFFLHVLYSLSLHKKRYFKQSCYIVYSSSSSSYSTMTVGL